MKGTVNCIYLQEQIELSRRQLFLSSAQLLHLRPQQGATFALVLKREYRGRVPLGKKHSLSVSLSLNGGRVGGLGAGGGGGGAELCILTQRHG